MTHPRLAAPTGRGRSFLALWSAMRPAEWLKNGFVVAPLLFSGRFDERAAVLEAGAAFLAFCAIASAVYLVNDVRDREFDREHPDKRHRAIAAGRLSPEAALGAAAVLAVVSVAVAASVNWELVALVLAYAALAVLYSLWLKRLVIVDVMTLAAFFLVRVGAGAVAIDVEASEWVLCCTAMLALLLGFAKRRQELNLDLGPTGASRPVLARYSTAFVDQMIALTATGTIVSYAVYAIDSPLVGSRMLVTAPPVLYGLMRYIYLLYDRMDPRPLAVIATRDPGIVAAMGVWAAAVLVVLATR